MSDKEGYVTIPVGQTDVPNSNGVIYPKEGMGKGYNPGSNFFNEYSHAEPVDEDPHIHDPKTEKESDTPRQMEGDGRRQLLITKSGFTYPQPKSRR